MTISLCLTGMRTFIQEYTCKCYTRILFLECSNVIMVQAQLTSSRNQKSQVLYGQGPERIHIIVFRQSALTFNQPLTTAFESVFIFCIGGHKCLLPNCISDYLMILATLFSFSVMGHRKCLLIHLAEPYPMQIAAEREDSTYQSFMGYSESYHVQGVSIIYPEGGGVSTQKYIIMKCSK